MRTTLIAVVALIAAMADPTAAIQLDAMPPRKDNGLVDSSSVYADNEDGHLSPAGSLMPKTPVNKKK